MKDKGQLGDSICKTRQRVIVLPIQSTLTDYQEKDQLYVTDG